MARPREKIDELADEITALQDADRVKLMSAVMERDGRQVDWSLIARIQKKARLRETPALHREINAVVREVRRARRRAG